MKSKSIILLITLLCLCLVFIACSNKDNNEPANTETPSTQGRVEETTDETQKEDETNPADSDVVTAQRLEKEFDKTITVASDGYTTTNNGLS